MIKSLFKYLWLLALPMALLCVALVGVGSAGATAHLFTDSGQALGSGQSNDVSLGDVDGDGDLDAFVGNGTNANQPNRVWLNDGSGTFTDSGQSLGNRGSVARLGDLDGDGDLDAFMANQAFPNPQPNTVWLNNGSGDFTVTSQTLGNSFSMHLALGDVDGDGDLDALVANLGSGQPNSVWLNNGSGDFTLGQSLGSYLSDGVGLGDLDGDGDLDAFVANRLNMPNRVWENDGSGTFSDSGQLLGNSYSLSVDLGDLDGDNDLDAFVVNVNQGDKVWLNNGSGDFTDSGQSLGTAPARRVALGDLDGDGDLDAFAADGGAIDTVWLNDGSATFSLGQSLAGPDNSKGVGLGDLDGDGDLDAFVANNFNSVTQQLGGPNKVWLNNTAVANQPPDCSQAAPSQDSLWPPNHKFKSINVNGVADPDTGDAVTINIDSIFQDEPVNGEGDGNTSPDGQGVDSDTAKVRAERSGGGNGRVYEIKCTADDGNGGTCLGTVKVGVPHDKKDTAVNDNAITTYDSTAP